MSGSIYDHAPPRRIDPDYVSGDDNHGPVWSRDDAEDGGAVVVWLILAVALMAGAVCGWLLHMAYAGWAS